MSPFSPDQTTPAPRSYTHRGGVCKRKAGNLMDQGWKAQKKKTSRSLFFEPLASASPGLFKSNRALAKLPIPLPTKQWHPQPQQQQQHSSSQGHTQQSRLSAFQMGHIAATCDMHLDLEGRKPTPIPRTRKLQLHTPENKVGSAEMQGVQRCMETLDTLTFDMASVLQLEDSSVESSSCCSEQSEAYGWQGRPDLAWQQQQQQQQQQRRQGQGQHRLGFATLASLIDGYS